MNVCVRISITDKSLVAEARRTATGFAERLGFPEEKSGAVALLATESATNLIKHTLSGGEIIVRSVGEGGAVGIELLVLDKGPGIANLAESRRDGYSTAGSPGTGLGALERLSDSFEIWTQPAQGTALAIRIWAKKPEGELSRMEVEGFSLAKPGQNVSGDAWAVAHSPSGCAILVADGLGHGEFAAEASRLAVDCFRECGPLPPQEMLEAIHAALKGTRGAAAAVVEVGADRGSMRFAGVGNIAGSVIREGDEQHLVSMNGILGHDVRVFREFVYPWPPQGLLILSSDGLATRHNWPWEGGLINRPASLIAGVLYRDLNRGRDDCTVVVARERRR